MTVSNLLEGTVAARRVAPRKSAPRERSYRTTTASTVKVTVVNGDPLVREGLKALIDGTAGFSCVGAFDPSSHGDGPGVESSAVNAAHDRPDVILLDLCEAGTSGIETVREIRRELPSTAIVVFAPRDDDTLIFEALCAGVEGCLMKPTAPAKVLEALREAHEGGSPISAAIASRVVKLFRAGWVRSPEIRTLQLTPRETAVLRGLAEGRSYKEIAEDFHTSINTVRFHIRNLYEKLQANSQAEAVAKGLRMGLI